tara:strand:- start:1626 stop:2285 length:660 start_codon:yes stop_codon:yes gene_type:complete
MTKGKSEQALDKLRIAILTGKLAPGTALKMSNVQEICGVSVSSTREALAGLVSTGLVTAEHNRGYQVASLSVYELDDLVATRIRVEGWALQQSIETADEFWEANILSSLHLLERLPRMQATGQAAFDRQWEERHIDFHRSLISSCGSEITLKFCDSLRENNDRYRRFSATLEKGERDVSNEHRKIAEAAIERDAKAAVDLLSKHYRETADIVRGNIPGQ